MFLPWLICKWHWFQISLPLKTKIESNICTVTHVLCQIKFVRTTWSSFWNILAFLCKEPWGLRVSNIQVCKLGTWYYGWYCQRHQVKLKISLPPEKQWPFLLPQSFRVLNNEIAFLVLYFLTTIKNILVSCLIWECLSYWKKKSGKITGTLQIPDVWGFWILWYFQRFGEIEPVCFYFCWWSKVTEKSVFLWIASLTL